MKRNKILAVGLSAILGAQVFLYNAKEMQENDISAEYAGGGCIK